MDDDQQFCLRWNNHQSTLISVFDTLLESETLVDCTLAAEGKFLKAHKVVLSACSPYFSTLLSQQYDKHPIFILKDVKFQELRAMMDYMYRGEVNISQDQLAALLKAAESLQIKGLSDSRGGGNNSTNMPSQAHLKSDGKSSQVPAPKASGYTIENKRPLRTADFEADVSGSREGSASPSTRKRKKVNQRRKSLAESNSLLDNHDQHSNSSSHSNNQQQQQQQLSNTSATSAPSNNMSVTNKKTEHDSNQQDHHEDNGDDEQVHITKRSKHDNADNKQESELMIEPKNEYDDDDDDEDGNVEDLTMDDEMLEDLDQAGPSHGGEGSSQGYHWQMDGRSQESQEAAGQHRDAQGTFPGIFIKHEYLQLEEPQFSRVSLVKKKKTFFRCNQCSRKYKNETSLTRHKAENHKGIKFRCPYCEYKCARRYLLHNHIKSHH